jgi:hypothetical protein
VHPFPEYWERRLRAVRPFRNTDRRRIDRTPPWFASPGSRRSCYNGKNRAACLAPVRTSLKNRRSMVPLTQPSPAPS